MTLRVRNRSGKVVFTRAGKALRKNMHVTWDGRDARGRALPAGNYYAKVSGVDMDGLRGSTEAQKVVVSAKRLVRVTRTVTLSPRASIRYYEPRSGCNGCYDNPPPPPPPCGSGTVVASDRFTEEGALSYRSGTDPTCEQSRRTASTRHALTLHELAPRGGGSASVSVFGGPTTPGASDQGSLSVGDLSVGDAVTRACSPGRTPATTRPRHPGFLSSPGHLESGGSSTPGTGPAMTPRPSPSG